MYCTVDDIRAEGFAACSYSDDRVQVAIDDATVDIERYTRRFFEPRDKTIRMTWKGEAALLLGIPIIRIDALQRVKVDGTLDTALVADTDYFVFNRHVREGMLEEGHDDRESPKIVLAPGTPLLVDGIVQQASLALRSSIQPVQNMSVTGRFGYTDASDAVARSIAAHASDAITAPDLLTLTNGAFTEADVATNVVISGAANPVNDGTWEIAERISATVVRLVATTLVTEATGFAVTIPSDYPQSGVTPREIRRACLILAADRLPLLANIDPVDQALAQGRVSRMAVRDQSISFIADERLKTGSAATMNAEATRLLTPFRRPPRLGAA